MTVKVFISAGHGGSDPGAISYDGKYNEKDFNLAIAKYVKEELDRHGVETMLSRDSDVRITVDNYVKMCNEYRPTYALDIHNNASSTSTSNGSEVFHSINGGTGQILAQNIQDELVALGQNDRGIKTRKNSKGKDYYGFIRSTICPAVIVECGFMTNKLDVSKMNTPEKKKAFAIAIAKGVLKTANIPYIEPVIKKEPVEEVVVGYRVQMGVYKNRDNAQNMVDKLTKAGFKPAIVAVKVTK